MQETHTSCYFNEQSKRGIRSSKTFAYAGRLLKHFKAYLQDGEIPASVKRTPSMQALMLMRFSYFKNNSKTAHAFSKIELEREEADQGNTSQRNLQSLQSVNVRSRRGGCCPSDNVVLRQLNPGNSIPLREKLSAPLDWDQLRLSAQTWRAHSIIHISIISQTFLILNAAVNNK